MSLDEALRIANSDGWYDRETMAQVCKVLLEERKMHSNLPPGCTVGDIERQATNPLEAVEEQALEMLSIACKSEDDYKIAVTAGIAVLNAIKPILIEALKDSYQSGYSDGQQTPAVDKASWMGQ